MSRSICDTNTYIERRPWFVGKPRHISHSSQGITIDIRREKSTPHQKLEQMSATFTSKEPFCPPSLATKKICLGPQNTFVSYEKGITAQKSNLASSGVLIGLNEHLFRFSHVAPLQWPTYASSIGFLIVHFYDAMLHLWNKRTGLQ